MTDIRDEALDWTTLANIIREVDGNHDLGAGELADRILAALAARGLTVVREGELEARDEVVAAILAWPALPEYPRLRDAIGAYRARLTRQPEGE